MQPFLRGILRSGRLRVAALAALAAALAAGPAAAGIGLPTTVDPGDTVTVTLDPPAGAAARLVLTPVVQGAGGPVAGGPGQPVATLAPGAARAEFTAPARAGSYRLTLEEGSRLRESAMLEVAALPVALSVPVRVFPATLFDVRWSRGGGTGTGDLLRVEAEDGRVLSERLLDAEAAAAGVAQVRAPDGSGHYRLVYVDGASGTALASQTFRVEAERAWLRAPFQVPPRGRIEIDRHGPGGAGHALRIVDGAGAVMRELSLANSDGPRGTVVMEAPGRPGRYALVYLNVATGEELSNLPLLVRAN